MREASRSAVSTLVAVVDWLAIGLGLGGPTGYAINPARDFGPRAAHAILPISDKGSSHWEHWLVMIIGPLMASGIAAAVIKRVGIRSRDLYGEDYGFPCNPLW